VTRSSPADRFCLTPKVRSLSDGFLEDDWIADVAAPEMAQFTRDLVWPAALMTFDRGRMLVRETTHEASVLSIDHGMVGRSLPMLRTAAGRCYLACCSTSERRAILEMLARSPAAEDEGARELNASARFSTRSAPRVLRYRIARSIQKRPAWRFRSGPARTYWAVCR
jgi:IclR family transcriptional regulator, mhp operon transcriptional activator